MGKSTPIQFVNREISWLSFNERVLQEAEDEQNPMIERLRFLGIFSNNRDEFFRVRVATVKRMLLLSKKEKASLRDKPEDLLASIHKIVVKQEVRFNKAQKTILKGLEQEGVYLVKEDELSDNQADFVNNYFRKKVRGKLVPLIIDGKAKFPELKDRRTYLAVKLSRKGVKNQYALIEVPTQDLTRFLILPNKDGKKYIILLDDVIRFGLHDIFRLFPYDKIQAHAFKITRDAELDLDDDVEESILHKLERSIKKRKKAEPVRVVHDEEMPSDVLDLLKKKLHLSDKNNIIFGGRYHNFRDFMGFPEIGAKHLRFSDLPPLAHPDFDGEKSLMKVVMERDVLLSYPYQTFDYTLDILREAAIDPTVSSIRINVYRVASSSMIMNALINAARNGKNVTAVIELRARFDEEHNIYWSQKLQDNNVKVTFGVQGLKVHSKLILITRKVGRKSQRIAHIGTGNFHESTAKLYTDNSLWTSDPRITNEVYKVFQFIKTNYKRGTYRHLMVSPFNSRRRLTLLISQEIEHAKKGRNAYITLKLNNLVDDDMVRRLCRASQAGVKVKLIIRGMCSLVPGVPGLSDNIEVISVLDRFLEHSRILVFGNNGDPLYFISSADWMERNLDRRVEVTVPIYDDEIKETLQDTLDKQMRDNVKARIIDKKLKNEYVDAEGKRAVRSQNALYKYFKNKLD